MQIYDNIKNHIFAQTGIWSSSAFKTQFPLRLGFPCCFQLQIKLHWLKDTLAIMTRRRVLQRCNSAAARRYYQRKGAFLEMRSHFQHLKSQETQNGSSNIIKLQGGFLKWWYPTTMGFPTKDDHFGVFGGYHHLRKHPYIYTSIYKYNTWNNTSF